mmetsp:Transcript_151908/g.487533  ORF Transcript_151908/g.487533 Transcript_151908/m.487533 type:complete len:172 (+) Transcript_151908:876-1391(+)
MAKADRRAPQGMLLGGIGTQVAKEAAHLLQARSGTRARSSGGLQAAGVHLQALARLGGSIGSAPSRPWEECFILGSRERLAAVAGVAAVRSAKSSVPFKDHSLNFVCSTEDYHAPCAWMARACREESLMSRSLSACVFVASRPWIGNHPAEFRAQRFLCTWNEYHVHTSFF